jgi:hypothetical protein
MQALHGDAGAVEEIRELEQDAGLVRNDERGRFDVAIRISSDP